MLRCIDVAIHIATNRVKARRRSTHRPPWQIPEVHKPKRYFYVELHRVGCTGITNIALPGGGLSSGFHVSRKMPLGKTKSKLLAVKNGMQNPWPARPILRVRQAVPLRRTRQLANSLTNASNGWTAWPERTVHLGLLRKGDLPGIGSSGCIAEGYGASPHVNTCRVSFPVPWVARHKPRRFLLPKASLQPLPRRCIHGRVGSGPRSAALEPSGPQIAA